ncbi:MAG: hypothetical protein GXY86_04985 [Firmicutes bacterium]|nr:hypothetical protein [Bacillota bacterium]
MNIKDKEIQYIYSGVQVNNVHAIKFWDRMGYKIYDDPMNQGNIIVLQMTNEGIEHSWKVEVQIGVKPREQECFRKARGYMSDI